LFNQEIVASSAAALEPFAVLPPEARETLEALGPRWKSDILAAREVVLATYTPLAAAAAKDGISVRRDVPYGAHARNVLDVYQPENATGADVVLFVHGGAFVRGSKSVNGEIYDNLPYWFARQGLVSINVEYRLAADAPYPGGAEDVAGAVEWAARNIGGFGGDPQRLFLIGHSAGATHVGTYILDPVLAARRRPEVRGMVLLSGRLRADALPDNPNAAGVRAYFGDDASRYDERSPVTYAERCDLPVFVAIAEYENPYLDVYGAEFFFRVAAARKQAPRFMRLPKHNHTSMVAHFNTGEELLGREILSFIKTGR
jgi:acetyl esterase